MSHVISFNYLYVIYYLFNDYYHGIKIIWDLFCYSTSLFLKKLIQQKVALKNLNKNICLFFVVLYVFLLEIIIIGFAPQFLPFAGICLKAEIQTTMLILQNQEVSACIDEVKIVEYRN